MGSAGRVLAVARAFAIWTQTVALAVARQRLAPSDAAGPGGAESLAPGGVASGRGGEDAADAERQAAAMSFEDVAGIRLERPSAAAAAAAAWA